MDFDTGNRSEPAGSGGGGTGVRPPGMSASAGGEFDYRDPVRSFVRTVTGVLTQPARFFAGIRRRGDFANPLIFAVICFLISTLLGGIISIPLSLVGGAQNGVSGAAAAFIGGIAGLFVSLIVIAILTPILLFVWAGILHLLVTLLVKPTNAGFEATFRSTAYASMPGLISWIPLIGTIVGVVWSTVLNIIGIREVHSTTTGRAALVVLIPLIAFFLVFAVLAVAVGIAIFSTLNNQ